MKEMDGNVRHKNKCLPENTRLFHFDGLFNDLNLLQKVPAANFLKKAIDVRVFNLGNINHCIYEFTEIGLGSLIICISFY